MTSFILPVSEIFFSLQGEGRRTGLPTTFIRLVGCPLRCVWCDSEYAFAGGTKMTLAAILAEVAQYPTKHVCVTGGEPLAHVGAFSLIEALCDKGCDVAVETSGALPIDQLPPKASAIMDLKAPGSGEEAKNRWENLAFLQEKDEIKLVLADRADYEWARDLLRGGRLPAGVPVLLSAVAGCLSPTDLAEWLIADGLNARLQLQLHKILWGNMRGK
ncbi:MAG: 7-carboxy-7-deazaguanine synthase QueE [Zoogloeaceae bacterium]|jgi:7-carboxy-7-deazaguanine synthase|nr:7-carboxy-7-deazaguanine synthase QueE [Zoogloeaceae bacterium]